MLIYLPPGPGGEKVGVDDYLVSGHSLEDLLQLATAELRRPPFNERDGPYVATEGGLVWMKPASHGPIETPLTNFTASIVADVIEDDGAEQRRCFELEGRLGHRSRIFRIPASQFASMNWATEHLGAAAIVYPGFGLRDHARAAVQLLSGQVPERQIFAHTGWRRIDGQWIYLHGDGAIGAEGAVDDLTVQLAGSLANYRLPQPLAESAADAIAASLRLLDLGPLSVMAPLLGATFLAPLREALQGCQPDFVVFFHGGTGNFKTEATVLAQAHYGPFIRTNLPTDFKATANAIERTLFAAKDALVLVDDYHPAADRREEQAMAGVASRLLRGAGNGSGRQRMRADTSLRPDLPPRGVAIATGERLPTGHSTAARMFPVAVDPGAIDQAKLTSAQEDAWRLPMTMATYVSWLAGRLDDLREMLPRRFKDLRAQAAEDGMHAREPGQIAHLHVGLEMFLRFAVEMEALQPAAAAPIEAQAWEALVRSSQEHRGVLRSESPTERFIALLSDGFASKRAYLEDPHGGEPSDATSWGWERTTWIDRNGDEQAGTRHAPAAVLLGQITDGFVYLLPEVTYQFVASAARQAGQTFPVELNTLLKRLDEARLIECEAEAGRRRRTINRRFGASTKRVIKLRLAALSPLQDGEHGEHGAREVFAESELVGSCSPLPKPATEMGNAAGARSDSLEGDVPQVPPVPYQGDGEADQREVYVV